MADIFLSYADEDREAARALAGLLESAGWTAWWDRHINAGRTWRDVLEEALGVSRCTVVLWSAHSVESPWVKEEAEESRALGKLVLPVLIEAVNLPIGFRSILATDLTNWDGSTAAPSAQQLIEDMKTLLGKPVQSADSVDMLPPSAASNKGRFSSAVRGTAAAVAGAVVTALELLRASRYWAKQSTESESPPQNGEPAPEPVLFGIAAPREAAPGSSFTARFAAYIAAANTVAQQHLENLGEKDDRVVLDIPPGREPRWCIGAPITIRLTGEHLTITPAERQFEWNGRENLASFAVQVDGDAPRVTLQLCFHVFLGPVPIAFIPLGLAISGLPSGLPTPRLEVRAPSSAFASYSSKDAEAVQRSLSTLSRWAPTLDIFQDCLDLKPNDVFKQQLAKEIAAREVFLLLVAQCERIEMGAVGVRDCEITTRTEGHPPHTP